MKNLVLAATALSAVLFLGACDRQPFEVTKKLHEPYQEHHGDAAHGDAHGKKDAHAPAADAHGEKKAH